MTITIDNRIVRFLDLIASGLGFSCLSLTALSFVVHKDVGHKLLLWLATIYFGIMASTDFVSAYEFYFMPSKPCVICSWLYLIIAVLGLIFCYKVVTSSNDILTTLRTSEAEDRIRHMRQDDIEQARLNFAYIDLQSKLKSLELVKRCEASHNV